MHSVRKELYLVSRLFFILMAIGLVVFYSCAPEKKKEKLPSLTIWHWMSDRQKAFEELAKKYEEEKGIKVRFEVFFPPEVYSQKIQAAAAARSLPDLFGILGEKKIFASFIKGNYIEDLTPYMEENSGEWKKRFINIALLFNTFEEKNSYGVKPGIYGVPIDMMSIQFIYNRKLLKEAGFDENRPPQKWEEFIKVAKQAQENLGVHGFVCGWGESWFIYCLITNLAFNVMGEEKFFATLRGEVPYTDKDWVMIFSVFKEMKEAGILPPGIITMNNKEAEQMFAYNKAVFSFNGSWGINTYFQMNPELDYDTMLPPFLKYSSPSKIWAGAGSSFVVNKLSSSKKEAIEFLKWLTEKPQQLFLIEKTRNLPSIRGLENKVEEKMRKFLKNIDNATHPNLWPLNENSRVVEAITTGIQEILIGEKSPEQVASDVERMKTLTLKE